MLYRAVCAERENRATVPSTRHSLSAPAPGRATIYSSADAHSPALTRTCVRKRARLVSRLRGFELVAACAFSQLHLHLHFYRTYWPGLGKKNPTLLSLSVVRQTSPDRLSQWTAAAAAAQPSDGLGSRPRANVRQLPGIYPPRSNRSPTWKQLRLLVFLLILRFILSPRKKNIDTHWRSQHGRIHQSISILDHYSRRFLPIYSLETLQ